MDFYKKNATAYAESTFSTEFAQAIYNGMKDYLLFNEDNAPILDIGCGSGRDANHLISLGHQVDAFDQSPEMIEEAQRLTGLKDVFKVGSAQDFQTDRQYQFAYSIACLLHLNDDEFQDAITHIFNHIHDGGFFFFTLKKGEGEETDQAGRYFNYYTEDKIQQVFKRLGLFVLDVKEVADLTRPDTAWYYILIQKPTQ